MKFKRIIRSLIERTVNREKTSGDTTPGKRGENLACRFLKGKGYRIIKKNFRTRFGEIDIVADDNGTVCFVEVKARSYTSFGLPEEFVDRRKQKKLVKTALAYTSSGHTDSRDMRFDIVSVDLNNGDCRIIKDAFDA